MVERHIATCTLCEAACGIVVETEADRVVSIRGDDEDPASRGYLCPKAHAMGELHHDPDRLRTPLIRDGSGFREASWDEALRIAIEGFARIRRDHGKDAMAVYYGNPTAHNLGLLTHGLPLTRLLGTKNVCSASSTDQAPQMLAAEKMFGHVGMVPIPDVDRTDYFLIVGANPLVSNGSLMNAPDMKRRIRAIRERGGKVVVIDPRRTETAEVADEHVFVRPGTDAFLVLAMLHVIFEERLERVGRLRDHVAGLERLRALSRAFAPSRVAERTGVSAETIARLARAFSAARTSVAYGRIGTCTQEHGTLASWLLVALNVVCGRLDEVGGAMFATPAVDPMEVLRIVGMSKGYDRWRSRVRGLPELMGEIPVATLADEIETSGPGQVRALLTFAGNPALSAPNGPRLERALATLEHVVCVDAFLNETTRHAHVILPPVSPLQRAHYDLALHVFSVRNAAKYVPPVFPRGENERHDWEIMAHLTAGLVVPRGLRRASLAALLRGPDAVVDAGLRAGPYGLSRRDGPRLSLKVLRDHPHGFDLGPLEPRLPSRLYTRDRKVDLAPELFVREARALEARLSEAAPSLVLIGRRHLRSNNSWLHNASKMVKGPRRCTLLVHPDDARTHGLRDGYEAELRTRVGRIVVPVEISDEVMRGVVSLPHGWGHTREGTRMSVASEHAGVSVNDVTDETFLDRLSGNAGFSGVPILSLRSCPEVDSDARAAASSMA
ncbi:MAG: molybdopterin-dependent oxidoreductase [Deltaproteobacteria bacterium]|nr:molybdopterin-dependent oxidoreductase [Deltaproteobacteria bacterium]